MHDKEKLRQYYIACETLDQKFKALSEIYINITVGSSIVFVGTKKNAEELHKRMSAEGHEVSLLTSDLKPQQRDSTLDQFIKGLSRVLIATDVLSRGIDIDQVSLVINFDLPVHSLTNKVIPETYLHRIGRTARNMHTGIAISLLCGENDVLCIKFLERHFGQQINELAIHEIEKVSSMLKEL